MPKSILTVKGIGPATAEKLAAAGFASAEDLAAASLEQVTVVPGFAEFRAKQVIDSARQQMADAVSAQGEDKKVEISGKESVRAESEKKKPLKKKKKKKAEKKKNKKEKRKKEKVKKDKAKKGGKKKKAKKKKK